MPPFFENPVFCPAGFLTQQSQGRLGKNVRLGQHRGPGLNQDVQLGESGALLSHIHIDDAAVGGAQILVQNGQLLTRQVQTLNVGTHLGAHVGKRLDRGLDVVQGRVRSR